MKKLTDEQIQKAYADLRERQQKARAQREAKEWTAKLGTCWKYRNSYSSPCEGWWLYSRILRVSEDGYPVALRFQTTVNGKIEVEVETCFGGSTLGSQISEKEWTLAWADVNSGLKKLLGSQPDPKRKAKP